MASVKVSNNLRNIIYLGTKTGSPCCMTVGQLSAHDLQKHGICMECRVALMSGEMSDIDMLESVLLAGRALAGGSFR